MAHEEKARHGSHESESSRAKKEALEKALCQIERQFGTGAIMRFGQKESLEGESISTGAI